MQSRGFVYSLGAGARRSFVLLWTAVFLCSLLLQYVTAAAPAPVLAVHDEGLFELDGNVSNDAAPGADWNNVYNHTDGAAEAVFITDPINGNGDKYFNGGSTKDVTDITSWLWTTVSQPQDKNDIQDAYAAAYRQDGSLLVYFGLDRYASNGAAQVGFWFLQDQFGLKGGPAGGSFDGSHVNGDVLVQVDFENGGASPVIRVYEWQNGLQLVSSGGSCATSPANDTRCAIASTGATSPAWTFNDKFDAGTNDDIPAGGMVEGGIDLTALGLDGGCFASFVAETRSSPSPDSTLSDFAFGSFSLCSKPDISTRVRQDGDNISVINKGESVYDRAALSGDSGTVAGSIKFFVCRDGNGNPDCSTGGDQVGGKVELVGGKADSADFTPSQLGYYCFRAEYTPEAGSKYLADSHTNQTTECFQVIPAEIKLTKTADDGSVSAGEPIGFTLTILSKGPGSAHGVKVSDTLPADGGLDWSIESMTGAWSIDSGVLSFGGANGVTMAKDDSYSVHVVSPTTKATCGVVDNTGDATTTNDGTSSDSASVTVNCPDIKVTKTPDGGSISAGDTAAFTIKVENLGPGRATGVVVSDTLPAGLSWTEDEADCSIDAGVLTCTVGDLAVGASQTYTVGAVTTKDDCGVIDNTATASATNEKAADEGNNSDDGAITVRCAVIDIEKSADADQVSAGDPIGFAVTVTNTGDGTAYGVTASDTLDPAFTWTLEPSTGWTLVGNQLSFASASMAPGASSSVHVSAPTTATDCRVVPNTATASAASDGSDQASAQTEVLCPDVVVVKTAVESPVTAGDPIAFDIVAGNVGEGMARDVTLTDTLPAGIAWTEDSDQCSIIAGVLSCDFGDLAKGASATVRVSGNTDSADCGVVPNTATVAAANEPQSATGNNSDSDSVVVNCPDIKVTKTADNSPINAGDTATFTVVVENLGPGTAYDVTVGDPLPAGVTWTTATTGCSVDSGTLNCDLGDLAVGASATIHVSGTTSAAVCGTLLNTAAAWAANEPQGSYGNNQDSASIIVQCPDLEITKTADTSPISAGDVASYTILVENIGDGTAYDVTLTDTLPAGITWVDDSDACVIDAGVLTCDFGTILPAGAREVTVSGETTAADCGELPNQASTAASNEPAGALDNNTDDATIVVDCPQIVITKSTVTPVVNATDDISFDIVVTNTGPGAAYNVAVNDPLPVVPGVSFSIDVANSDAGWSLTGGTLSFGPATLAAGASTSVRIVSTTAAASCGPVDNVANLTYQGGSDADDSSLVIECPDVTIAKTADDSPILAGEDASFTISVWNQGDGTAYDVVISDPLPAGLDWTDDSDACEITDGTLTCQVGDLGPNHDPFTVTVSAPTTSEACGDLDNRASVSASNEPADLTGNNEDGATVEVQCAAIELVKTAGDAPDGDELLLTEPGDVVFTYVATNTGTADLANLVLVDDNATPDDPSDDIIVSCPSTSLVAGASMTCTVTLPASYGLSINVAVVTAVPEIGPQQQVTDTDDAAVRVPEPVVTPTPKPTRTPRLTPPPTSTIDATTPTGTGTGLLLVLLSLAGILLAIGYLVPSPARARRRNRRG